MKLRYNYSHRKKQIQRKVREWGLIVLTLALTLLSIKAQFHFWNGLFGLETAVIAALVFETMRLTSLFALLRWQKARKMVGVMVYIGIALFCGSVAITSWLSEIIAVHDVEKAQLDKEYQTQMEKIRIAYAEKMNERIVKLDKDLYWVDSKLASDPESQYWTNRKQQLLASKGELLSESENFLSVVTDNPEQWIQMNAALLGLQMDPVEKPESQYTSIENAIINIWHMSAEEAKKAVAIVFVIVIEIGIVFLAVMTGIGDKDDRSVTESDTIMTYLRERYPEGDINMFILKCRDRYQEKGDLPKASELTVKLRSIREVILNNGFSDRDIKEFFQSLNPVSRN